MSYTKEDILLLLDEVKDPEIPVISLVDLGVITDITIVGEHVSVTMTPTFLGCPAIDYMKNDIADTLNKHGITNNTVTVSLKDSWNSDKVTEKGRKALKEFGLAPPPVHNNLIEDLDIIEHAECPNCDSTNTTLKSPFGPTLCRSLHHCNNCGEAFESFKPI
ncbi:phenylacetate-CoA oxygenase subunit PaaJ [Marivirga atlantica]|jgi:ring-1,2-phenylacetyl-CoA epoxidase subunit PaaD|uniref:Phenylacetate-CoA oxygenase subunit PaaJ n=1 Tax=Marivirga atlantica TaxID=1548457 RepID=A0A937DH58_9BACT|nr:1,2-phenylacetyl-CoA epoxidase subunit PaaD [Marivirga atlantica]MBL0765543.1 phenylacetate-CoA oxygenase subunit PaaJ [Marivirga atlantica]